MSTFRPNQAPNQAQKQAQNQAHQADLKQLSKANTPIYRSPGLLGVPLSVMQGVGSIDQQEYIIAGAGFAGLCTGFWLKKRGIPFRIIEKRSRAGGMLGTVGTQYGTAESAANGFIWCRAIQDMADELGLEIIIPEKKSKNRYLVRNGKMSRFPLRFSETLGLAFNLFKSVKPSYSTIDDFSSSVFGSAFTKYVVSPGLSGIYGAEPSELSFPAILPGVAESFSKQRTALSALYFFGRQKIKERRLEQNGEKRPAGTHSFAGGIQTFIDAISKYLAEHITYEKDVFEINPYGKQIISTLPAYANSAWLKSHHSVLSALLGEVEYFSMRSCTTFFELKEIPEFKEGFGCLIPESEGFNYLGILFNHCIFNDRAKAGYGSFTGILRDDNGVYQLHNAAQMAELLKEDLIRLFGKTGKPLSPKLFNWENGIPCYSESLYKNWAKIDYYLKQEMPGFRVFGNYTGEISLRGMASSCKTFTAI